MKQNNPSHAAIIPVLKRAFYLPQLSLTAVFYSHWVLDWVYLSTCSSTSWAEAPRALFTYSYWSARAHFYCTSGHCSRQDGMVSQSKNRREIHLILEPQLMIFIIVNLQNNRLIAWSVKCQKFEKNGHQRFPESKKTSSKSLFCPNYRSKLELKRLTG